MNLYNPTAGSQIPNMRGLVNYVVLTSLKRTKQPVERIEIVGENPKVYKRRFLTEFGIARNAEVSGRRRTHSTKCILGKGSRLFTSKTFMLAGIDYVEELKILKSRLDKGEKANNLSRIMSDPNFFIACWVRIRSKKGITTPVFDGTLNRIKIGWFKKTSAVIRNGGYKFGPVSRTYLSKFDKKLRLLISLSPKDKVVQEGMRFLLELIYEPLFLDCSYAWRPNRGCHDALNKIRMQCKTVSWYIEGGIEQQFSTIDHNILVSLIQKKVHDQGFIDLIFKYVRVKLEKTVNSVSYLKKGLIQSGILSPILTNIYMHSFDDWVMNDLKVRFDTGLKRQKNKEYVRQSYETGKKLVNKCLRSTPTNDSNWKRLWYYRYADNFIVGVDGSKQDAISLKDKIRKYLGDRLKQTLNDAKSFITHAETGSVDFLGHRIHRTFLFKMVIK